MPVILPGRLCRITIAGTIDRGRSRLRHRSVIVPTGWLGFVGGDRVLSVARFGPMGMAAMPEQVHRNHSDRKADPNPVIGNP